jgi:type I restriction enzyme, R subunit
VTDDEVEIHVLTEEGDFEEIQEAEEEPPIINDPPPPKYKLEIKLSDTRTLSIINVEIRYIGADGKPLSATEFLKSLIGMLPDLYQSEEQLREIWQRPETRKDLLKQLQRRGLDDEQLETLRKMFQAENCDIFDVLNHISYNKDLMTRKQRAARLRGETHFFSVYSNLKAKDFLLFILERYEQDGIEELERDKLSELIKLKNLGTAKEAALVFGGKERLLSAFYELQRELYKAS